jgi:hypothetical protein
VARICWQSKLCWQSKRIEGEIRGIGPDGWNMTTLHMLAPVPTSLVLTNRRTNTPLARKPQLRKHPDLSRSTRTDVSRLAGIVRATLIYSSPPTSHATPLYPTMLHALSTTARSRPSPKKVPARIEAKAHGSHQEAPTRQEERRS